MLNLRVVLPSRLSSNLEWMKQLSATLGVRGAIAYRIRDWSTKYGHQKPRPILARVPGFIFLVSMRTGRSSDLSVLIQIALDKMFEPLRTLKGVKTVADCGANAGYSSAWFLSAYPDSKVIAVEPDRDNAKLARENLRPYGQRAEVIEAAVWNRPGLVTLLPGPATDTREWARMVQERDESKPANEVTVEAITVPDLIAKAGGSIDLMKNRYRMGRVAGLC